MCFRDDDKDDDKDDNNDDDNDDDNDLSYKYIDDKSATRTRQERNFVFEPMTIMMMTTMTSLTQAPMQVAQTRLEKRSHRTENENCNDAPHIKIVEEVKKMMIASFLF